MSYNVDWPNAEYHQILPGLFLGGHLWQEAGVRMGGFNSTISTDGSWDYIVSAYLDDYEEAIPQCDTRFVLFDDTEDGLDDEIWRRIRSAVDEVVDRWYQGQKVLIRCQAGYNRSGMIMSLVLMSLGFSADMAIKVLRQLRGRHVLINSAFERCVRERESEYRHADNFVETEAVAKEWMALLK